MNSVHLVTREKYRVEPGQKLSHVHQNTQPGPAAHPRRAQAAPACACRAPPRAPGASLPLAQPAARSPAPYARAPSCLQRLSARPRMPSACRTPARPAPSPAPQLPRLRAPTPTPARPSTPLRARLLPSPTPCRRYSDCIVAWLGTVLQYSPALPSP